MDCYNTIEEVFGNIQTKKRSNLKKYFHAAIQIIALIDWDTVSFSYHEARVEHT